MINSKVVFFESAGSGYLQESVGKFLSNIDVRQIIKVEHNVAKSQYCDTFTCMILYFEKFEDIRDLKIESIIETK